MKNQNAGFSLLELLVACALVATAALVTLNYSILMHKSTSRMRTVSTRDRVLSGIRTLAGMPASLRASMRAASKGKPINPQLLACAGGNPLHSCKSGVVYSLTLYSPLIARAGTGEVLGVQPISSPLGSATPMRLDPFGSPCTGSGPECPLLVFTSFRAQCGPALRPAAAAVPTSLELRPENHCSIADVIEVTYYVQLDPAVSATDSGLASFVTPISGTVITPVIKISGNLPK